MSTEQTQSPSSLLKLFQLIDSFFPTGAFAHSFGLETYVQSGAITNRETFEGYLRSVLRAGIRQIDVIALVSAYRTICIETVIDLDVRLTALKLPVEAREGSARVGRHFLRNARSLFADVLITAYDEGIREGICTGHHPIAYGLVASAVKIDLSSALLGYLHAYIVGQVSAAVRLIPLGATEGQKVLQSLQPELVEVTEFGVKTNVTSLESFTPGLDIRSMQHERLYSRLFIS